MTAVERIRERIAQKREEYQDFLRHLAMRLREEDLHACWDASTNATEVSNYIDGLEFALKTIEEEGRCSLLADVPSDGNGWVTLRCTKSSGHDGAHVVGP